MGQRKLTATGGNNASSASLVAAKHEPLKPRHNDFPWAKYGTMVRLDFNPIIRHEGWLICLLMWRGLDISVGEIRYCTSVNRSKHVKVGSAQCINHWWQLGRAQGASSSSKEEWALHYIKSDSANESFLQIYPSKQEPSKTSVTLHERMKENLNAT